MKIDLAGQRFGKWTVLSFSHSKGTAYYWNCVCDCGTERPVSRRALREGLSLSCGCRTSELNVGRFTTHGMTHHPAHNAWKMMKHRCENEEYNQYYLYGGRGIKVAYRWWEFENFWADMGPTWRKGLSLDRINVDGDYEPGNCRWATPREQALNRRTNRIIATPDGAMTVVEAAARFGIKPVTVFGRIRKGWPEDELLLPPNAKPHWKRRT